jgi:hypothetical protein
MRYKEWLYCQPVTVPKITAHRSSETHNTIPMGYAPTKKTDHENLRIHRNPKYI